MSIYQFIFSHWLEILIAWFSIGLAVSIHFCAAVRYGEGKE